MVASAPRPSSSRRAPLSGWVVAGLVVALGAASGCANRASFEAGASCELTTDCDSPLVCRLERCRIECNTTRDCPQGLQCLKDPNGLGVCQVEDDLSCLRESDCADTLVCHDARCVNECVEDQDCPNGQTCEPAGTTGMFCEDPTMLEECVRNSDCAAPLVCAVDRVCRVECRENRDCSDGKFCDTALPIPACVLSVDGGP